MLSFSLQLLAFSLYLMRRRDALKGCAALSLYPIAQNIAAAATKRRPPNTFDYAALKGHARALAAASHKPRAGHLPDAVAQLDWDQYQAIRLRHDHALWAAQPSPFRVEFFHLGLNYKAPVEMFELQGGMARPIPYSSAMFDYGTSGLDPTKLPADLGFAGFRVFFHTDWKRDIAAFLGASYFRAVGKEMQYGQSARALAIDCGMDRAEEFPNFTSFWFERPARDATKLTIYALLDSPSVAGAYRIDIQPAATLIMNIDAALYPRAGIERLGVAPLTSMFLTAENDRRVANDWRTDIHDSDGLALWTGHGEWIWRPLTNPASPRFNAYVDDNPRGFGLLQRDRNFDHYQDDGVFYERRPSVWVEPRLQWHAGSVQLVELPARDETDDNIVAFWNPARKPQPGEELLFSYRLHWGSAMPFAPALARVVATRTGVGGIVGQPRKYFSWRFVVDFAGPDFAKLPKGAKVEPVISASSGEIELTSARPLESIHGYRAMFDLKPTHPGIDPINLRLFLRAGSQPLTETWLYQWTPPPPDQRRL